MTRPLNSRPYRTPVRHGDVTEYACRRCGHATNPRCESHHPRARVHVTATRNGA